MTVGFLFNKVQILEREQELSSIEAKYKLTYDYYKSHHALEELILQGEANIAYREHIKAPFESKLFRKYQTYVASINLQVSKLLLAKQPAYRQDNSLSSKELNDNIKKWENDYERLYKKIDEIYFSARKNIKSNTLPQ